MRITKLILLDFGKFHQQEVVLSSGLNLVTGANESGKTTICRFMRSMLYGLERERGLRARKDDYTKYRPWEYGRYQGILEFELNGDTYRLFRNFITTEKQVTLTRLSNGETISSPEEFLRKQGLVSEAVFTNTFFVGNFCATGEGLAGDLKNYLANLAGTGGTGIDLQKSLEWLSMQRKEKQKQIPEKEIRECMAILMQKDEISKRIQELHRELEQLLEEQKTLEEEQRTSQSAIEQLLREQQETLKQGQEYRLENEENIQRCKETERKIRKLRNQGRLWLFGGTSFGILSFAFGMLSLGSIGWLFMILCAAGVLTGLLVGGRMFFAMRKEEQESLEEAGTDKEAMGKKIAEAESRYQLLTERFQMLQNKMSLGYERLKSLLPVIEQEKLFEEQLEEQLHHTEATEHRYEQLLKQREERMREIVALDLAMDTLRKVSGELYQEYGEKFSTALAAYAQAFTDGTYSRLTATEDLMLRALTGERSVEISDVSFGTGEQFYLALRFAAMDVFDPEKKLPVILDDSFASFDPQRLESAMLTLTKSGRQVVLFSCSGREETCAKGLGITYETVFE